MMAESYWDIERIQQELKKQKETRDNLITTNERMKEALYESQLILKDIPNEENAWRDRFEEQRTYNKQLASELAVLEDKCKQLQTQLKGGHSLEPVYEDMSDNDMRQLLKQLEKEKGLLEWQLKECEWRLDQEGAIREKYLQTPLQGRHKAEDDKKAMLTQLEHIKLQAQGQ